MTNAEAHLRLRAFVTRHGSQRKAAAALHVSQSYINELLAHPEASISAKVLTGLGLAREVTIRVKRPA